MIYDCAFVIVGQEFCGCTLLIHSLIDEDELHAFDTWLTIGFIHASHPTNYSTRRFYMFFLLNVLILIFDVDANVCRQVTISLKLENSNKNNQKMCEKRKEEWISAIQRLRAREGLKSVRKHSKQQIFWWYAIKATKHPTFACIKYV